MHKTDVGERRKALKRDARNLEKEAKALAKTRQMESARRIRQDEADRLKAEAEDLKDLARLEGLHIWQMKKEKATKKGAKTYTYRMASWREGSKVRNIHLGSCRKMDANSARLKARKMKAEAICIHLPLRTRCRISLPGSP
jgi:hypothetical protein